MSDEPMAKLLGGVAEAGAAAARQFLEDLRSENPESRSAAAEQLGRIGSFTAVPELIAALKDDVVSVRWSAAGALGEIGAETAVPELVSLLGDPHPGVRLASVQALAEIQSARAVPGLVGLLHRETEREIRLIAIDALAAIRGEPAAEGLLGCLKDLDQEVRWTAAEALGQCGSASALRLLKERADDITEEVRVRAAASAAVARIEMREALREVQIMEHPDALTLASHLAGMPAQGETARWQAHLAEAPSCHRCGLLMKSAFLQELKESILSLGRAVVELMTRTAVIGYGELTYEGQFAGMPPLRIRGAVRTRGSAAIPSAIRSFEIRSVSPDGTLNATLRETDDGLLVVYVESPDQGNAGRKIEVEILASEWRWNEELTLEDRGRYGSAVEFSFGRFADLAPKLAHCVLVCVWAGSKQRRPEM